MVSQKRIKKQEIFRIAQTTLEKENKAICGLKSIIKTSSFINFVSLLNSASKIIVVGIGKSAFAGKKFVGTLVSLGIDAHFLNPVDAMHGDIGILKKNDIVLALSFSGQTKEVNDLVKFIKSNNIKVLSITGSKKSALFSLSDKSLVFSVKNEGSNVKNVPMASVTATLVLCDIIASCLSFLKNVSEDDFLNNHPFGGIGLKIKVEKVMSKGGDIPLIYENDDLSYAIKKLNDKGFGVVAICDRRKKIKGVITDGDIRRFILKNESIKNKKAKECMTKNPKVIQKDKTLNDALSLMEKFKITNLFVVDSEKSKKVEGIIHIHQILNR